MKFLSGLVTRVSGSVGGLVGSRNRGGMYLRSKSMPVDPANVFQQHARSHFAALASRFSDILTTPQREAWDLYAENVQLPDSMGVPRNVGGIGMYVRSNVPRGVAALPLVDDAPSIFTLGSFTLIDTPTATDAGDLIGFVFDNTDEWANEDESAMLLFVGRPKNPGQNFFKGPFLFAGMVEGDAITPPTSPASIASLRPFEVGQKMFFRVQVTRADGRYSNSTTLSAIAV